MTAAVVLLGGFVAIGALARLAYRRGARLRHGLLPPEVVAELAEHKLRCMGEPGERVELELSLLLGVGGPAVRPGDETRRR